MITKIVYFNYSAIAILLVIIITSHLRKMVKGKINVCYLAVTAIVLFAAIFGSLAVNIDNAGPGHIVEKYIYHTGYLLFHGNTAFLYFLYLIILTDTWHVVVSSRVFRTMVFLPILLVDISLLVNFFAPILFYFNQSDIYSRTKLFIGLYVVGLYYLTIGIVFICLNKKSFPARMMHTVLYMYPITLFTAILEYFFPHIVIELFGNALSLLFVFTNLQRQEDIYNADTLLKNSRWYSFDCNNIYNNNKSIAVIMLNITNYRTLRGIIGYGNDFKLSRVIAQGLRKINGDLKLKADLYYLKNGHFRVIVESRNFYKVEAAAKKINEFAHKPIKAGQLDINLVPLVCVAYFPVEVASVSGLMEFGNDLNDAKFYTGQVLYAKDLYRPNYYEQVFDMNKIIERALATNGFQMYYQPIYSVKEKRITSAEALLRLKDEKYGFISPELFIPAAEKSGAIHKIGLFVLEDVCRFVSSPEFNRLGVDYVEVNLSVAQCMQDNLSGTVLNVLEKYNVSPDKINLEITETALAQSQEVFVKNLNDLVNSGLNISLDDFGSGYSNLQRIAQIPFEIVKIDKSFTDNCKNPKVRVILENLVNICTDLSLKIVVEGIETKEMLDIFEELNCDYIQGYYFSRPIPSSDFVKFVSNFSGVRE